MKCDLPLDRCVPGADICKLLHLQSDPNFNTVEPGLLHIDGTHPSLPHLHHQIRMFFQLLGNHGTLANTVLGQLVVTALTYHDPPSK